MDLTKLAIFQMARARMDWAAERQRILSENVANADTPGYHSHDLKELDFGNLAKSASNRVQMVRTNAMHQQSGVPDPGAYREVTDRYPYESSADGNEVILEEQMSRLSDTRNQYKTALELVRKHMTLIKLASRSGR
ncbi:flagellar basal body rod protein FlgB [Pararhodospirillum oryzae]|uniref:Flagellar basal body rod protein FlgB n=1 Tax=Pararhodospirillum oryzae TaxID=478448 RepID=A0A512H4A5_9PROT|nr:flagellar basal body rod protein FlgB [Pararhodospirillum oryzae]GEO80299.1 flagellar basal body rod protein FlgB [Pararhodospirillum oryzae]